MQNSVSKLKQNRIFDKLVSATVYCKSSGEALISGSYDPANPSIFYGGFTFVEIDLTQEQ